MSDIKKKKEERKKLKIVKERLNEQNAVEDLKQLSNLSHWGMHIAYALQNTCTVNIYSES